MKIKNEMKIQQQNEDQKYNEEQQLTSQKPPRRFSPKQINIAGSFFIFNFEKMITEVLLVLPLYQILFIICWRFRYVIKTMASAGDILNDDYFFGDVVDTPGEGTEQHKKRKELKSIIDKGKLGHKWTHERVGKASDEAINKTYAKDKQRELNEKREKTGKALGKHVINLYSTGISLVVKIRDVHKLQQDIGNDPIIKDQKASLGFLLVCTFGNFLAPVLVATHTVNNLELGEENEDNKND